MLTISGLGDSYIVNFILVTGVAGFIGYYVSQNLPDQDTWVVGLDNLNELLPSDLETGPFGYLRRAGTTASRRTVLRLCMC